VYDQLRGLITKVNKWYKTKQLIMHAIAFNAFFARFVIRYY
jgi:hypothetical protein